MSDIRDFTPLWGEWEVIEPKLGEGSFGTVWKVCRNDSALGKLYAAVKHISIPKDEQEVNSLLAEGYISDRESVRQYYDTTQASMLQEISAMHKLRGYTNLVSYEDHLIIPKPDGIGCDLFLRMELLTPLTEKIEQGISREETIKLGIDIASAIEVLNRHGMVHRDIKPQNVFINEIGNYKLGDFGTVRDLRRPLTMSQKGTYNYMAPEIYKGQSADWTVDVYSLGIMLYRFLNGNRLPFISLSGDVTAEDSAKAFMKRMSGAPIPPPAYADEALSTIVLKACAYDPKKRYRNGTELKRALTTYSVKMRQPIKPSPAKEKTNETVHLKNDVSNKITQPLSSSQNHHSDKKGFYNTKNNRGEDNSNSGTIRGKKKAAKRILLFSLPIVLLLAVLGLSLSGLLKREGKISTESAKTMAASDVQIMPYASTDSPTPVITAIPTSGPTQALTAVPTAESTPDPTLPPTAVSTHSLDVNPILVSDFTFKALTASTCAVTGYTGTDTEIVIPSDANGRTVVAIGDSAFFGCSSFTGVTIPDSVTRIGEMAFSDCSGLKSVSIPNSVTGIDSYAFQNCSGLKDVYYSGTEEQWNAINVGPYNDPLTVATIHFNNVAILAIVDSGTCGNNLTWTLDSNDVLTISGTGPMTDFEQIDAFSTTAPWGTSIKQVKVLQGVTSIGDFAFYECNTLTIVTIGNSVTSIGEYAFYDCSSLTSVTIPNSVTIVGEGVFQGCENLLNVTIPNSVISIGSLAFNCCISLTSVTIPNSVTSIGDYAFTHCSNLTSITIPKSVTNIGEGAFCTCNDLTSIDVASDNSNYCSFNGVLYNKTKTELIQCPGGFQGSFSIPTSVTSIAGEAFDGCSYLTSVTIPNSVTSIGQFAFSYCSSLMSVTIPNSVTYISNGTFCECSSLTSVNIPDSVISIDSQAFLSCSRLTSVGIPDNVTYIGLQAFGFCSRLTSITIPDSVTNIGLDAFNGCDQLTIYGAKGSEAEKYATQHSIPFIVEEASKSIPASDFTFHTLSASTCEVTGYTGSDMEIVIPSTDSYGRTVVAIGDWAFYNCNILTGVTIPASITSIGDNAFEYCNDLTSITIPNSVTSIGKYAFYNCKNLTSVTIPNSVTNIGELTFSMCESLTSIDVSSDNRNYCSIEGVLFNKAKTELVQYPVGLHGTYVIPNSVNEIGDRAFEECSGLTSITIPNSVTSIGAWAFEGCSGLTDITIPESVTSIGDKAFAFCNDLTNLTISDGVISIGTSAFEWCKRLTNVTIPSSVTSIGEEAFSDCSDLITINVSSENSAYCSVDGVLFNKTKTELVQFPAGRMGPYTIPDDVTRIGSHAFFGCEYLTDVTIPNSIKSIGDSAFCFCYALTDVMVPDSVTNIDAWAFSACKKLMNIYVSADNKDYCSQDGVLYNKGKTELVQFPAGRDGTYSVPTGVTNIDDGAFASSYITSLFIPDSVTFIDDYAFEDCAAQFIVSKGSYAKAYAIKHDIPFTISSMEETNTVSNFTFDELSASTCKVISYTGSDTEIVIPSTDSDGRTVVAIGYSAFYNNIKLTDVTIPESVTMIDVIAFWGCSSSLTIHGVPGSYAEQYAAANNISFVADVEVEEIPGNQSESNPDEFDYSVEDGKATITGYTGDGGAVIIPDTIDGYPVVGIGNMAFDECTALTSVTIPNSVTSIGQDAFWACDGLTSVTIANSVTNIGDSAFYGCSNLASVTIPDSVTSIGDSAFRWCNCLISITIPKSVTNIGEDAFYGCDQITIYGAKGSEAEKYATQHSIPFVVEATSKSSPVSDFTFNALTASTCEVTGYTGSETDIVIPSADNNGRTVVAIGDRTFYHNEKLISVTFPGSLTSIGEDAFSHCKSLTSMTIPSSVTNIGNYAFYNCGNLMSVTIPNGVTSIGDKAFFFCLNLTSISIPDSVNFIGKSSYAYCISLKSINVTSGNRNYCSANGVLYNKEKTELIQCPGGFQGVFSIPAGVTSIREYAFQGCYSLTDVTISNSVTNIGAYAFQSCSNLTRVTIPESVANIGAYAFFECSSDLIISCYSVSKAYDYATSNGIKIVLLDESDYQSSSEIGSVVSLYSSYTLYPKETVAIRTGPSTEFDIILQVGSEAKLIWLDRATNPVDGATWFRIQYKDTVGYVEGWTVSTRPQ